MRLRALGVLALLLVLVPAALAQEAQAPKEQPKAPVTPNLLMKMTAPAPPGAIEGIAKDDLRELPAPQMDRLAGSTRFHVVVGDKCLPGEDGFAPMPRPIVRPRSR